MYTSFPTLAVQYYRLLYVPPGLRGTLPTYSVCVESESSDKQRLFPSTIFSDWPFWWQQTVYSVMVEMNLNINEINLRLLLSVSLRLCSRLLFIYTLLLPEGKTEKAWENLKNPNTLGKGRHVNRRVQSNSATTSWKGLNIACLYKRVLL
jgi:hypothetical protein